MRTPKLLSPSRGLAALALALAALPACERAPALDVEIPGSLRLAELSADARARLEAVLVIDGVLDQTPLALSADLSRATGELLLPNVTSALRAPFALDLRLKASDGALGEPILLARASGELELRPHEENALTLGEDKFDTCGASSEGGACSLLFDLNRNGASNLEDLLAGVDPLPPPPFLDAAPGTLQFPSGIRLGSFARQVIVVENTSASSVEVRASLVGAPGVTLSRYEATLGSGGEGPQRALELGVLGPYEEAFLAVSFAPVNPYLTTGAVFLEAYEPTSGVRQAARVKVIANADGELQPKAPGYGIAPLEEGAALGGYGGEVIPFPTDELFSGLAITGVPTSSGRTSGLPYTGNTLRAAFEEERGPEEIPADAVFLVEVPPLNRLSVALAGLVRDVDLSVLLLGEGDELQDDPAVNHRPLKSGTSTEAVELRNEGNGPLRALIVLGRVEAFAPPAARGALSAAADPTPFDLEVSLSSAPELSAITPSTGPLEGGNRVTLTGRGFHKSATVTFADALALDCAHGEGEGGITTLTCTAPPGSLLVGKNPATVVVANPSPDAGGDGQAATYPEGYTYQPPAPRLDELSPRVAPTSGSSGTIALTGAFFSTRNGPPRVRFGQVEAESVHFVDVGRLEVVAPPQAAGVVTVTVQNRLGSDEGGNPLFSLPSNPRSFTYIEPAGPPPTLESLAPDSGSVDGGELVTLRGDAFRAGAEVRFGGVLASSVTFVSDEELSVRVPARVSAGIVDVEVVNDDGQRALLEGAYTYFIPSPTVTSTFPTEASTTGGTFVVVSGSGFRPGVQVLFTSGADVTLPAPNVNRVSGETLLVATPAVPAPGDYELRVINVDGQSASYEGAFRFLAPTGPPPRIETLSPASGFKEQATLVTLRGTDFRGPPTVLVGSERAEVLSFNDHEPPEKDELSFYAPAATSEGPVVVRLINSDGQSDTTVFTYQSATSTTPMVGLVLPEQLHALVPGDALSIMGQHLSEVTSVSIVRVGDGMPLGTLPIDSKSDVLITARNTLALTPSNDPGGTPYVLKLSGEGFELTSPPIPAVAPRVMFASTADGGQQALFLGEMLNPTRLSGVTLTDPNQMNPPVELMIFGKSETFVSTAVPDGMTLVPGVGYHLTFTYQGVASPVVPFPPGPVPSFGPPPLPLSVGEDVWLPVGHPLQGLTLNAYVSGLRQYTDDDLGPASSWSFFVEPEQGGAPVATGSFTRQGGDQVTLHFETGSLSEGRYRVVLATARTLQLAITLERPIEATPPRLDHIERIRVRRGGLIELHGRFSAGDLLLFQPQGDGSPWTEFVSDDYDGMRPPHEVEPYLWSTQPLLPGHYNVCVLPPNTPEVCPAGATVMLQVEPRICGDHVIPVELGGTYSVLLEAEIPGECFDGAAGALLQIDVPFPVQARVRVLSPDPPPQELQLALSSGCSDQGFCWPAYEEDWHHVDNPTQLLVGGHGLGGTSLTLEVALRDASSEQCLRGDEDGDGYDICSGDCGEGDPDVNPNVPELCNGIDDNCDGWVDEGCVGGDGGLPGPVCGDGVCEFPEDWQSCEQDCSSPGIDAGPDGPSCGDAFCEPPENSGNCPQDCSFEPVPDAGSAG